MDNSLTQFDKLNFDAYKKIDERGNEFWSARDLQEPFDYSEWRNLEITIDRAKISCEMHGQNTGDHFVEVNKMVSIGSGAMREVKDYHLTKYGAYLTAMNGDPHKRPIALAQGYFLARTQQAERMEELLKSQLNNMLFFSQVFAALMQSVSTKEVKHNPYQIRCVLYLLREIRHMVYEETRDYEGWVKKEHPELYKPRGRGDVTMMKVIMQNGKPFIQLQFPDEPIKGKKGA